MVRRGTVLAVLLSLLVFAAPTPSRAATASTLSVVVPGVFGGCRFDDPSLTPATQGLLDLARPSAFTLQYTGRLVGQQGAIASAELRSLKPQTVVYSIDPSWHWSDGHAFSVNDLEAWSTLARRSTASWAAGYHFIASLTPSPNGRMLTAVFGQNYPYWNNLFRDVEEAGTSPTCTPHDLPNRPSLGVYQVESVTSTRAVLVANPLWRGAKPVFSRVVLKSARVGTNPAGRFGAAYDVDPTVMDLVASASRGRVIEKLASTGTQEILAFSPVAPTVRPLAVRQALAWTLNVQRLINAAIGPMTYQEAPPISLSYSQTQLPNNAVSPVWPYDMSTTTTLANAAVTTPFAQSCASCAHTALAATPGYSLTKQGWRGPQGLLTVRIALGPTAIDGRLGASIEAAWRHAGFHVTSTNYGSDLAAATAARLGTSDVSVVGFDTTVGLASNVIWGSGATDIFQFAGWDGTTFAGAQISLLRERLSEDFNPNNDVILWNEMDDVASRNVLAWPLATVPYSLRWTPTVTGVLASASVAGFINEIPAWTLTPPALLGAARSG